MEFPTLKQCYNISNKTVVLDSKYNVYLCIADTATPGFYHHYYVVTFATMQFHIEPKRFDLFAILGKKSMSLRETELSMYVFISQKAHKK